MNPTTENKLIVFEGIDLTGKSTNCTKAVRTIDLIADFRHKELHDRAETLGEEEIREIFHHLADQMERKLINKDLLRDLLTGKRNTGAIVLDLLLKSKAIDYPEHFRTVDEIDDPQIRFQTHLMRLEFKAKIMSAILPYLHVICDRYYPSVYGRAKAMGIKEPFPSHEQLNIYQPDLTIVLTMNEPDRGARIKSRSKDTISPIDKMPKTPGGHLDIMEKEMIRLCPQDVIDCTRRGVDQIFAQEVIPRIEKTLGL